MSLSPEQIAFVQSPAGLDLLGREWPGDVSAAILKLRKTCTPEQASAIWTVLAVRRKARNSGKLPGWLAEGLIATDTLVQQASSWRLARYKAGLLKELAGSGATVWDLCCGLGADALALANEGLTVTAVDRDPTAVACAAHNASLLPAGAGPVSCLQADVGELDLPAGALVHVDPDRRASGRRTTSLSDAEPGADVLRRIVGQASAGMLKLSPALSWRELTDMPPMELRYVSESGACRQLLACWGSPTGPGQRWAVHVSGDPDRLDVAQIQANEQDVPEVRDGGAWLIEPGPAVLAAGAVDSLARQVGAWRRDGRLVWLFSDEPAKCPLASDFEILQTVPGRERDIGRALRKLGAGVVEVKPRGVAMDTDRMQRRLRGKGDVPVAVLWGRIGASEVAFLCRRG